MKTWTQQEVTHMKKADDLYISPFREDGATYGTPTWIWSVVVENNLYARAYNGRNSAGFRQLWIKKQVEYR